MNTYILTLINSTYLRQSWTFVVTYCAAELSTGRTPLFICLCIGINLSDSSVICEKDAMSQITNTQPWKTESYSNEASTIHFLGIPLIYNLQSIQEVLETLSSATVINITMFTLSVCFIFFMCVKYTVFIRIGAHPWIEASLFFDLVNM